MSQTFRFGRQSFEGLFDVFNIMNTSVVLRHITTNGVDYLRPASSGGIDAAAATAIPAAWIFRLSVRYRLE
jgi:hypothetical protein